MTNTAQRISDELLERPLRALALYEQALPSPEGEPLRRRFKETMELLAAARNVGDDETRAKLPELYAAARREERRRLLTATIDRLFELADDRPTLERIGQSFPQLVLDGALQQQFCCKLATRLGLRKQIPEPVHSEIVLRLIKALIVVLRVGAPTTRDSAVEGLGALLKLAGGDAEEHFPMGKPLPIPREKQEKQADYEARVAISERYLERLERRRLLVLTIAGNAKARKEFDWRLKEAIGDQLQRIRRTKSPSKLEDALYERQDLLRFLPGIARQSHDPTLRLQTVQLLQNAAMQRNEDERPEMVIAFARFQESVFRTIDTAMRRGWTWKDFDEVVAAAVHAIPRNMTGTAPECNAQVRATVAILRTAIHLVSRSDVASKTAEALHPLFLNLDKSEKWSNLGIMEGCFRGLSQLIANPHHDGLTGPGLEALLREMNDLQPADELLPIHRRLIANSAFRRLLVSLTDQLQERQLFESETQALLDREQVERRIRAILHDPTPNMVRNACQGQDVPLRQGAAHRLDLAVSIIDGIAFETDVLRRGGAIFEHWDQLPPVKQLAATRILAALLHSISRDAPELARHEVLRKVFLESRGISMPNQEATLIAWNLLASISADAAEAADQEIQRFTEYRGRQSRKDGKSHDLPGHILAMISPEASSRIAAAVAREMDLNRRYDETQPHPDFAKLLYQVMLRGPHESIFDHLLPRIHDPAERNLVLLFRKHVGKVLHSDFELKTILSHVNEILPDLKRTKSETLENLGEALELYRRFAVDDEVWPLLKNDDARKDSLIRLFELLDRLARATDPGQRKALMPHYERRLRDLRYEVTHYLAMPIQNFSKRNEPLTKAMDIAAAIGRELGEHEGLQPPERIMLVALMHRFEDLFHRTIRWYCEQPVQQMENEAKSVGSIRRFWLFFCDPPSRKEIDAARAGTPATPEAEELAELEMLIGKRPPEFRHQRGKFEEFFVHWRADNLDVNSLRRFVGPRWPTFFENFYRLVTNFTLTAALMIVPCIAAVILHLLGITRWEGIGFFVLSAAMIVAAVFSFTSLGHRVVRRQNVSDKSGYWFESLLPRMGRLTAVPMALIVEFDHSYEFPLYGSTWVLLFLMCLSLLSTRFFVTREIVDRPEKPGWYRLTEAEKASVRQIVALALAHSFGIAVLLAAIFASSYKPSETQSGPAHQGSVVQRPYWDVGPLDEIPPERKYPNFLWVLPREVKMDFGEMSLGGWRLMPEIGRHACFRFYPTVILAWTALGLFFGVFLEGFMKGERLRKREPGESASEA